MTAQAQSSHTPLQYFIHTAALSISYTYSAPWPLLLACSLLWAAAFLTVCSLRVVRAPARFSVPLVPVTPALGVFFTVHLVCSLGWPAYVRFAVWMGIGGAVYGLYSARAAEQHEGEVKRQRQESRREQQLAERAMPRSLEPERPQGLAAEAGGGERGWLLNGAAAN